MNRIRAGHNNPQGFTLVEVVVVIILLGILSVYAVPRFVGIGTFERSGFYQETVSAARYAHTLAVGRGGEVRIHFNSQGYELLYKPDSSFVKLPSQGHPVSSSSGSNVDLSSSDVSLPHNATFDALGRCNQGCNNGTLTISVGGKKMIIHEQTGYVETP